MCQTLGLTAVSRDIGMKQECTALASSDVTRARSRTRKRGRAIGAGTGTEAEAEPGAGAGAEGVVLGCMSEGVDVSEAPRPCPRPPSLINPSLSFPSAPP